MARKIVIQQWCQVNLLDIEIEEAGESLFVKADGKTFLVLDDREYLFDAEMHLDLTLPERKAFLEHQPTGFLFQFGGRFYWGAWDKDYYESNRKVKVGFNQFKFIGKPQLHIDLEWVHLGVHSEYELNNGNQFAEHWAEKAKFLGLRSIGICDYNTLGGVLAFQLACDKKGLKPVIGMTTNIVRPSGHKFQVKVYAQSKAGWRNLLLLSKNIHIDQEEADSVSEEFLLRHAEGLAFVFGCYTLPAPEENYVELMEVFKLYSASFEQCFWQLDTVEYLSEKIDMRVLNNIKFYYNESNLQPILLNDSYYIDQEAHRLKKYVNKADGVVHPESEEQHFKTLDESFVKVLALFGEDREEEALEFLGEAINNTLILSEACDFKIDVGRHKLPKYEVVSLSECAGNRKEQRRREAEFWANRNLEPGDMEGLFHQLLEEGWATKLGHLDEEQFAFYYKRLETELGVIVPAGFIDYFLILWDIVRWCKHERGIMVGSGRGSVAGSLIAYLLDITTVDPIPFGLLFERFINETRVSGERAQQADALPDIDLDFESKHRNEVKRYLEFKYGKDYVCSIGAYGRMKVKSGLKDFAKVKGLSFSETNYLTSFIDEQLTWAWEDIFKYALQSKVVYDFVQKYPEIINTLGFGLNQATNNTVHASAVIIVPKFDHEGNPMTIYEWLPVKKMKGQDGEPIIVSQWEGKYTDRGGYLKEDILGLDQLDKFHRILDIIRKQMGQDVILEDIPLDEREVFRAFGKGWVEDVFQFGSDGLRSYCIRAKPKNIEHIIAMNALYRPGPMSSNAHTDFADILNGKKEPTYDYMLHDVTEPTLGLYVYQEQIMKAVVVLGGLSLVESDNFRTAIKKFDKSKMAVYEQKFIAGAIERGCDPTEAKSIWLKLLRFSGYGFNKSHSAAYSIMSYWSMWLKIHYPVPFWAASLQFSKDTQIPYRIFEMSKINSDIQVVPPNINQSTNEFACDIPGKIIFWSLTKIKGIADAGFTKIMTERAKTPFVSVHDFMVRMKGTGLGKDKTLSLVLAGCFDECEGIKRPADRIRIVTEVFEFSKAPLTAQFTSGEIEKEHFWIMLQRDLTGFGDIDYPALINKKNKVYTQYYTKAEEMPNVSQNKEVVVAGQIDIIRPKNGKKGKFAEVRLRNNNGFIDVLLWTEAWTQYQKVCQEAYDAKSLICVRGTVKFDDYRGSNCVYSNDKTKLIVL